MSGFFRALAFASATVLAIFFAPSDAKAASAEDPLTVFAAASLTDAMTAAGEAFTGETGLDIRFSFASSSTLARQIEAGAPAHIFASANETWMDYLEKRDLIASDTRISPIANRLALVAPRSTQLEGIAADSSLDLATALGPDGRLAVGDPVHVPAGIYAKEALETLGLWKAAELRIARADNVRAALALVESGEAPLGITYATDARISQGVIVLDLFPRSSHAQITYPFALLAAAEREDALAFLAFLTGEKGIEIFESFGFVAAD